MYGCYWTVVIAQLSAVDLTSHIKSTIKAVDREKHPNDVLVYFKQNTSVKILFIINNIITYALRIVLIN